MELFINLEVLKNNEITPNAYCFLVYLYLGKPDEFLWTISDTLLKELEDKGYIKITPEEIVLKSLFKSKFGKYLSNYELDSWINDYRELFPARVMSGGRPVRGDKQGCLKKMKSFVKNNPSTSKEEIFEATKIYVFMKKREDYKFMSCADYFIEKDGVSLLASLVEHYRTNPNILKESEQAFNIFTKQI